MRAMPSRVKVTAACARASARITSSCQIDSAMNTASRDPVDAGDGSAASDDGRVDQRGDEDRDLGVAEMDVRALARRGGGFAIAFAGGVFVEGRSHGFNMMCQFRVHAMSRTQK